jgi:dUTP pyrophosphatase
MKLNIRKIHPEANIPEYATPGSAGLDLCARIPHDIHLQPGVRFTCPTGLAIELPEGYEARIQPRSGLARKHGVTVLNAPGCVDSDFRGEICVILINHGDEAFTIKPNDRIAQMIIAPFVRVELVQAECLSDTERGEGGFGSTGIAAVAEAFGLDAQTLAEVQS